MVCVNLSLQTENTHLFPSNLSYRGSLVHLLDSPILVIFISNIYMLSAGDTCALNRQAQRDCYFLERDKLGQTPLHYACMCGHLRNVVTIIQYVTSENFVYCAMFFSIVV